MQEKQGMETIQIGTTGLRPTRIALGTWAIGGWMWGGTDKEQAIATILSALERGINIIDTAPVYGLGEAECIVGEALRRHGRRDEVLIATKVGLAWDDTGRVVRDCRPQSIRAELESSLQRLGVETIDLYQVHWPDPLVPIEETARTLAGLYEEGRIRAIGVSNYSVAQLEAFAAVAPLHSLQPPYNLFERAIEHDILPWCREHKLAVLAYGALCRGLLSGKVTAQRKYAGDDLRNTDPKFQAGRLEQYLAAVARLDALAKERYGKNVLALAIRFILDREPNSIALWGARRPDQLDALADVAGWHLDQEALAIIDTILAEEIHDPVGPEFMAPGVRG